MTIGLPAVYIVGPRRRRDRPAISRVNELAAISPIVRFPWRRICLRYRRDNVGEIVVAALAVSVVGGGVKLLQRRHLTHAYTAVADSDFQRRSAPPNAVARIILSRCGDCASEIGRAHV